MRRGELVGGGSTVNTSVNTTVSPPSRGLYVGGSGHVNVTLAEDGTILLLTSLAAGHIHRVEVSKIWASGTTATNVVILR